MFRHLLLAVGCAGDQHEEEELALGVLGVEQHKFGVETLAVAVLCGLQYAVSPVTGTHAHL
jgi:hypothetical protein